MRTRSRRNVRSTWIPLILIVVITAVASVLRLAGLTSLPSGLHGDEAILGLEAERVLREGFIGPYSPSALGQPAGPFYPAALSLLVFGNTILAVRIYTALVGILTIPALFLIVRYQLGTGIALLSAVLLAGMGWHIFYSRIGFPLIAWPLWLVMTAGAVAHAWNTRSPRWWVLAGVLAGGGIYTYNAHPLALAAIVLVAMAGLIAHTRRDLRAGLISTGSFLLATFVAMVPMIWYAIQYSERYFGRFRRQAAGRDGDDSRGWLEFTANIPGEYVGYWYRLCCYPVRDSTDSSGVTETVPLVLLILAAAGMVVGLLRYRNPLIFVAAATVLVMPLAAVFTEGATMRRTFAMAPFLCLFGALLVVECYQYIGQTSLHRFRPAVALLLAAALAVGVGTDGRNYFITWRDSEFQRWVFVEPYTHASLYLRDLPDDTYVYFLASRWSINYETRRFLAPDVQGEDRSERFGDYPDTGNFQPDMGVDYSRGSPVFVLIGDYQELLPELQRLYPGGRIDRSGDPDRPHFVAYVLPPEGR